MYITSFEYIQTMILGEKKKKKSSNILKKQWTLGFFPLELFNRLKRQQLMSIGSLILFIFLFLPHVIWLSYQPVSINNPLIGLAKFNAFFAISTLSLNFILAARLKIFETLFLGLDRMYRVHKMIGRASLLFIILHPLFLMVARYPNFTVITTYLVPIGPWDVSIGVLSVYIFLFLIALTVAIKIPYHCWHQSHRFLGIVLIFAGLHAIFAGSDINSYPILRYTIILYCFLGIIAWLYMAFLYKRLGPRFNVTIEQVKHLGDITELYFRCPKGFHHHPGQFLFIRFPRFEGYKELFPFSISNDPSQSSLRISVKKSGDYTSEKIPQVKKGDQVIIMGPYGKFGEQYLKGNRDMLWIAGGIGITPFLSLASHESLYSTGRDIHLIWVIRNQMEAFNDKELQAISRRNEDFDYVHWFSDEKGRITAEEVVLIAGGEQMIKNKLIMMCGPPGMMYSIARGLNQHGVSSLHIIFEDFNMLD